MNSLFALCVISLNLFSGFLLFSNHLTAALFTLVFPWLLGGLFLFVGLFIRP